MVMECNERLSATVNLCQYEKIKCSSPCVNGSKFCSRHLNPSHQCTYVRGGTQCKNRIAGTEQRTLCSTHIAAKASRKRRRTEAPAHKDLVNKTPPLALHVFRIMTQERQRLKFKPNMYKRPLEHLKWVMKREKMNKNPIYPTGMEAECLQHDTPHNYVSLQENIPIKEKEMCDIRCRSVYLAKVEERLHHRLDSLVHQVDSFRRTQSSLPTSTKAIAEAARSSVAKTTLLLDGSEQTKEKEKCPCTLPNKATRYSCCVCSKRAIPFTKYCMNHILQDHKQLLFSQCNTVLSRSDNSCPAPTVSITGRPCSLHSLLERYGVTESHDIETESSSSESEPEEEETSLEHTLNSWPPSPEEEDKKKASSPPPIPDNNHQPPMIAELDMLPMQPDTILESSLLPEEPDIPLPVRFMEPNSLPTNKRIRSQEDDMQARAMAQYMKFPGPQPGYFHYPYNYNAPVQFLHGYNKEGEPIYGYHDNKQHEFHKYMALQQPNSGSESGSRPTTPVINPEMMAHFYQQQRFLHPTASPNSPSTPEKEVPSASKKKQQRRKKKEDKPDIEEQTANTPNTPQVTNPHTSSQSRSPKRVASPVNIPKSKPIDTKKESNAPQLVAEQKTPVKSTVKRPQVPKTTPVKTAPATPQDYSTVMVPPQQPAVMNPAQQQPGIYQYQQAMYPPHLNQQYYLQMYMQPGTQPQQTPPPSAPLVTEPAQTNGPVPKDQPKSSSEASKSGEATGPELTEYQKYALQQQRQRQMMIAAQSQMAAGQFSYPQQLQYYQAFPSPLAVTSSPVKTDKKRKPPTKEKVDKETGSKPHKKKPSLNSPASKDTQLSSVQSLLSTASSGRLPLETVLPEPPDPPAPVKSRSKKGSAKEDTEMKSPATPMHPGNFAPYYPGYVQGHVPGHVQGHVLMPMAPMKGGYVNGTGSLYFRVDEPGEMGQDNKPVIISDAILARNRPSSVLMKNPGWVERYIKKPDIEKVRSKSKASPRRSPQKAQHRNLIFHNTEIGTISDKLAKQQKNAEQRSSHRAMCNKSKSVPEPSHPATPAPPPPSTSETNNTTNNTTVYIPDKADKLFLPDKLPSESIASLPEGVT